MKYLKLYEQINNYDVKIMTIREFSEFFYASYGYHNDYNLTDKIHYFSFNDLSTWAGSKKHNDSVRFIVAYNDKDILGVCMFAWFDGNNNYSISYLSTNKEYFNQGISKKILEELFKYFSKTYPNSKLSLSGYSVDGWKYLRKYILHFSEKYNVEIIEKAVEYITDWNDENRELFDKSRKKIKDKYGKDYTDMLGYNIKESSRFDSIMKIINNAKIGDILPEDIIYQYVQESHNYEDFEDGDLGDRIEEFSTYKLLKIKLDDIDLDEFELDEVRAEEFAEKYKETEYYPPIIISNELAFNSDYRIIDGNHRANGLKMVGEKYVKAFVGWEN